MGPQSMAELIPEADGQMKEALCLSAFFTRVWSWRWCGAAAPARLLRDVPNLESTKISELLEEQFACAGLDGV